MTDDDIRDLAMRSLLAKGLDVARVEIDEPRGETGVSIGILTTSGWVGSYYVDTHSGEVFKMPSATPTAPMFERFRTSAQQDPDLPIEKT